MRFIRLLTFFEGITAGPGAWPECHAIIVIPGHMLIIMHRFTLELDFYRIINLPADNILENSNRIARSATRSWMECTVTHYVLLSGRL
jgi:hypothetical protein